MNLLETNRLILREFNADDANFILELLNTPSWLKFIGDRNVKNINDANKYISDKLLNSYSKNGFGLYLITTKNGNIPVGMCGLIKREVLENVDLGFALCPSFTGNGYAFEAAFATLNYAKTVLKLERIIAITTKENKNSIKLLEKLNFVFEKMVHLSNEEEELMLFSNRKLNL